MLALSTLPRSRVMLDWHIPKLQIPCLRRLVHRLERAIFVTDGLLRRFAFYSPYSHGALENRGRLATSHISVMEMLRKRVYDDNSSEINVFAVEVEGRKWFPLLIGTERAIVP